LERNRRHYSEQPEAARALIHVGESPVGSQMDPIELASWTILANTALNLDEVLTQH